MIIQTKNFLDLFSFCVIELLKLDIELLISFSILLTLCSKLLPLYFEIRNELILLNGNIPRK